MLVGFLISVAIYGGFMGHGRERSVNAVVGITIGVSLLLNGVIYQNFGPGFKTFPTPFPQGVSELVAVALLLIVLILRPRGLLGRVHLESS